jgi:hypothetical protein
LRFGDHAHGVRLLPQVDFQAAGQQGRSGRVAVT